MWIQNSTFIRGMSREQGGAMLVKNTNFNVKFSNFIENYAKDGGALALICSPSITCIYDIDTNQFTSNYATTKGGAIYYNKHRPQKLSNNVFNIGNYAPYGPEMAGYPYSVIVQSYDNIPLASGQAYQGLIKIGIIDADGQIVTNDNSSATDQNTKISGEYLIQVENGIGIFQVGMLKFYSMPGSKNVSFKIQSSSIDTNYIMRVFEISPNDQTKQINLEYIYFDFRQCQSGEINSNGQCIKCGVGYYSLNGFNPSCIECMENAECPGGDIINVLPGFWRSSNISTNILPCLYDQACIGNSLDSSNNAKLCNFGYEGNLCNHCSNEDGVQFMKLNRHECGLFRNSDFANFRRQVTVATIVIIYSMHPTITRMTTSLYFCMELDKGEYWLQQDLQVKCWTKEHLIWSLGIGLISVLVWIFGVPIRDFNFYNYFFRCFILCQS
ncbi:UNKNOWN [Stylonychia lemnae]|uniref:Transmembrane protein n=1 Tax=Stylonychia lemnae TaxID=5949 RepID=A0A078AYU5_STYLE|nr:UNKNOWN [Stylonychia lemnae]|eukprot:CDW87610.1 UNKNOWN [Stylonychia lemnae]